MPSARTISTHAPLAGRDFPRLVSGVRKFHFNPRAPCGARRRTPQLPLSHPEFQPTRPLRGATTWRDTKCCVITHFNPRAPCGARHGMGGKDRQDRHFNPRAPCGARLERVSLNKYEHQKFQPTRPLRGATTFFGKMLSKKGEFQPTRPLRGATRHDRHRQRLAQFQPTRPLRGATGSRRHGSHYVSISTHAPLAGRDGFGERNQQE